MTWGFYNGNPLPCPIEFKAWVPETGAQAHDGELFCGIYEKTLRLRLGRERRITYFY